MGKRQAPLHRRRHAWAALLTACVLLAGSMDHGGQRLAPGYTLDTRFAARAQDNRIKHLIFHYTYEGQPGSLRELTRGRVSAHYLIPGPGQHGPGGPLVLRLVEESRRAWHAGYSAWQGRRGLNDSSIGIEIVNLGPRPLDAATLTQRLRNNQHHNIHWDAYDDAQIEALIALSQDIIARHGIEPQRVLGHADIAPRRKLDPGPAFPWRRLHEAGIGAWPDAASVAYYRARFAARPPALVELQQALADWGYDITATRQLDTQTRAVLRAFQMHFRPADYRGQPDAETAAILWALREKYQSSY